MDPLQPLESLSPNIQISGSWVPNYYLDNLMHGSSNGYVIGLPIDIIDEAIVWAKDSVDSTDRRWQWKIWKVIAQKTLRDYLLVHGYISRDVHAIQELTEQNLPDFNTLQKQLKDLYNHRHMCLECIDLVNENRAGCPGTFDEEMKKEFDHTTKMFEKATDVIDKQVSLLTTLASLKETQLSIEESHSVGRLTRIATIYLPFSTVATVLAMPGSFAPGAGGFWIYWVSSIILAALVIIALPVYEIAKEKGMIWRDSKHFSWKNLGKGKGSTEQTARQHAKKEEEAQDTVTSLKWLRGIRKRRGGNGNSDTESARDKSAANRTK